MFNYFLVPVCLITFWFLFVLSFSMSLNSVLINSFMLFDEFSLHMTYLTCFLILISFLFALSFLSVSLNLTFLSMFLICVFLFSTNNYFYLYLFYEASLAPILFIILNWGSYPERSLSAIMLLVYTSLFTFPFIYVLFNSYSLNHSFIYVLLTLLTFSVNLPIYGLHFWLPMAHVEAPTFGSMILAGILLKLGGIGLVRFSSILTISVLVDSLLSYFMIFTIYVTVVCCLQSDFNRLVAYSSVSHIIVVPILLMSNTSISFQSMLLIFFIHGLSSPVLFMLVGLVYSSAKTRQFLLIRGLLLVNPIVSFFMLLSFFFTISAPPFPSFVGEVFFMMSSYYLSSYLAFLFLVYLFLSIVYNLNWLSSMVFGPVGSFSYISSSVAYLAVFSILSSLLLTVPFCCVFFSIA